MGKMYNGNVSFANGFNYSSATPIDDRLVVATKEDLLSATTWYDGDVCIAYQGMNVTVADEGETYTFVLSKEECTKENVAKASSWYNANDWEEL